MTKVKVLNTPTLLALNGKAIKAKRNRALADGIPLDPDGIHLVSFSMVHNDIEMRLMLMLKLVDSEAPVTAFLDVSFEDYAGLAEVDSDDIAAAARAQGIEGSMRRHPVTMNRLAQVAVAYKGGGAEAVIEQLGVSKSQAYRLIEQARSRGVIA